MNLDLIQMCMCTVVFLYTLAFAVNRRDVSDVSLIFLHRKEEQKKNQKRPTESTNKDPDFLWPRSSAAVQPN